MITEISAIRTFLCLAFTLIGFSSKGNIVTVYVYNDIFSINPPGQTIEAAVIEEGDSIRWLWVEGDHTTTSVSGSSENWNEPINENNTEFIRQFNTAGLYWYYCIPHGTDNGNGTASGMSSTVTVVEAGSGACCLPNGDCTYISALSCMTQGGNFVGSGVLCDTTACTVSVVFDAIKDNTIYKDTTQDLSNALAENIWTGILDQDVQRRGFVAFDVSQIPNSAEVDSVYLRLYCNESAGDPFPVRLYPLSNDWGEGTSSGGGDSGSPATSGDVTWAHTFYDTGFWPTPGGDFIDTASATNIIDNKDIDYLWTSNRMVDDVVSWIDSPALNFGWIIRGDEATKDNTKRFSSKEASNSNETPWLKVIYSIPPTGACCFNDGSCDQLSETECTSLGGTYKGYATACSTVNCTVDLTPYVDSLPRPAIATPVSGNAGGTAHYRIAMQEVFQQLHSELPPTRVWGYEGVYPGPTIEATKDSMVTVTWINDIRKHETGVLRTKHVLDVDTCVHGPNMTGQTPVTVVHLHGGKVSQDSDGYPEDVFAPGDSSWLYYYPNIQPSGILWYHDHALGITRLNVYMGLAGFYLIRDSIEASLNLPSGEFEIPLVLQDRSFNQDGSLQYPSTLQDHFFGDKILVNGKVWPYLNVKKGKYRFRLLNGSNSRAYTLSLSNGAQMTQIGTELGLMEMPLALDSITLLPGERADVVIDFSGYPNGTEILLTNSAPAPFPGFPGVGVVPKVMKFVVTNQIGFTASVPPTLAIVEEFDTTEAQLERVFDLEIMNAPHCGGNHLAWTINGLFWNDITEFPVLGSSEIWTWHNETGVSHPMHMHLVAFQILHRQAIDLISGQPTGPLLPPKPHEKGWKDTADSPPGFRTSVMMRFTGFTGLFSHHCHILEHEDHEMMRQFDVRPCTLVTKKTGNDAGTLPYAIECAAEGDTILFAMEMAGDTILLSDSLVINKSLTLLNAYGSPVTINASGVSNPITITGGKQVAMRNLIIISGAGDQARSIINSGNLFLQKIIILDQINPWDSGVTLLNKHQLNILDTVQLISVLNDSIPYGLSVKSENGQIHIDSLASLMIEMDFEQINGSQLAITGTLQISGEFDSDLGSTISMGESAMLTIQGILMNPPLLNGILRSSDSERLINRQSKIIPLEAPE